jgi:outer membrane protein OmpA-like peptidoglycan-associated protein
MQPFCTKLIAFAAAFLSLNALSAQQVQWAHEVVSYSSQWDTKSCDAAQVLGYPNAETLNSKCEFCWAPSNEDGGKEFIRVRFENAIHAQQIAVFEALNPGAITEITLYDIKGKAIEVYQNKDPKTANMGIGRAFYYTFPRTQQPIKEAKVEFNTRAVPGYNQIDAIGIADTKTPLKQQIDVVPFADQLPNPENLGPLVNSSSADRLPVIAPDGKTLYFTRKFHPENLGDKDRDDIWVSELMPNGQWGKARNIGPPLNNEDHNFVVGISPDGTRLYLGNEYKGTAHDGVSSSSRTNKGWSFPSALNIKNMYNEDIFVTYHVSVDEKVLMLAVERQDGLGERDIYVSFKYSDNTWSEPLNLGPDINTKSLEASAFLAADMRTLYFSSAGHPGYGGLDIFVSRRLDDSWQRWSKPQNMGMKINCNTNDYSFTIPARGDYAYFSAGDIRNSDLYRIPVPKAAQPDPVDIISTRIVDAETRQPIPEKEKFNNLTKANEPSKPANLEKPTNYTAVVPQGKPYTPPQQIEGYYVASPDRGRYDLEELDYDGKDPNIIRQHSTPTPKPVPPANPAIVKQNQDEVDELKKKLGLVQLDITQIETQRAPDPVYNTPTTPVVKPTTTDRIAADPELEKLRNKYANLSSPSPSTPNSPSVSAPARPSSTPQPNTNNNVAYNEPTYKPAVGNPPTTNYQPSTTNSPQPSTPNSNNDPELERMRNKFNANANPSASPQPQPNTNTNNNVAYNEPTYKPALSNTPSTPSSPTTNYQPSTPNSNNDPELERLRNKFNANANPSATPQPQPNTNTNNNVAYNEPTFKPAVGNPPTTNYQPSTTNSPQPTTPNSNNDPELERLRNKFNANANPSASPQPQPNNNTNYNVAYNEPTYKPALSTSTPNSPSAPATNYQPSTTNSPSTNYQQPTTNSPQPTTNSNNYRGQTYDTWQPQPSNTEIAVALNPSDNPYDPGYKGPKNLNTDKNVSGENGEGHANKAFNNQPYDAHANFEVQRPTGEPHGNYNNTFNPSNDYANKTFNNGSGEPASGNPQGNTPWNESKNYPAPANNGDPYRPGQAPKAVGEPYPGDPQRNVATNNREPYDREMPYQQAPMTEKEKQDMAEQLRKEIIAELQEEIVKDLQREMLGDVRKELAAEMAPDLQKQLRSDLQDNVEASLRYDLEGGVRDQLRRDLRPEIEDELRAQLRKDLEKQLRDQLYDQIRDELRNQLRDKIREELKREMELQLKKEIEKELRKELEAKIRKQLEQEERDRLAAVNSNPTPSPGSPTAKPEYIDLNEDIVAIPIKVGQVIPLNNLYFDANKTSMKDASNEELQKLLTFLQTQDKLVVEIGGHTNGVCSDEFAGPLSNDRAKAVRDYLVANGIAAKRISYKGYGKSRPVASDETTEGRKKNQRVEMTIVEIID